MFGEFFVCVEPFLGDYYHIFWNISVDQLIKARCFALPAARDVSLGKPEESCWALNERRQDMWITMATMDSLCAACGENCPKCSFPWRKA